MHFTLTCAFGLFFGICFANHNDSDTVCNLPPDAGMCYAYFPMFFYDAPSGTCINFIYGGCGGNGNRFWTEEECMKSCAEVAGTTKDHENRDSARICSLNAEPGVPGKNIMCLAYIPRFYFNSKMGHCEQFIFGGCGGNSNSFSSKEECEKFCGSEPVDDGKGPVFLGPIDEGKGTTSQKPVDEGKEVILQKPVDEGKGSIFPQPTGEGKGAIFPEPAAGGKGVIFQQPVGGGKGVIFQRPIPGGKGVILQQPVGGGKGVTLQHAPQLDICNQEKQLGNCSSQIIRYYFDKDSKKCEIFIYSGCGENDNNFVYKFECERTCPGEHDIGDICSFKEDSGPCRAYFPRFYFSSETGQCEQFVYGGCQGNHNNFKTKEECLRFCTSGKGSPLP